MFKWVYLLVNKFINEFHFNTANSMIFLDSEIY